MKLLWRQIPPSGARRPSRKRRQGATSKKRRQPGARAGFVATITSLIGAMSYWIADAVKLKARATERLRLQREFEQAGDPPDVAASKAAAIVKAQEPAAIPAWVMLGGLALLAWQVLRG